MKEDGMDDNNFQYSKWTNEAFIFILKRALTALSTVQDRAIYITFFTQDAILPDHIKTRYNDTITIVLENEFWNLNILDDKFDVLVIFDDNEKSKISVLFDSIISFSDKKSHVCFEFHRSNLEDKYDNALSSDNKIISLDEYRKK